MKTKLFTIAAALGVTLGVVAQNSVSVDTNAEWIGYANIFDPATGDFVFGENWGVADIKSTVDASGGTITLQPNFNTYADNPTDPFWVDQTTGEPRQITQISVTKMTLPPRPKPGATPEIKPKVNISSGSVAKSLWPESSENGWTIQETPPAQVNAFDDNEHF